VGELGEAAYAIAFLAGPAADYITGINLQIDGGMSPNLQVFRAPSPLIELAGDFLTASIGSA
jgi:hypothetical protein